MSDAPLVKVTHARHVATLTLNRPEKRNALSGAVVEALAAALADVADDPAVHVVAIRGEGPDFCAGADLEELARTSALGEAENLAECTTAEIGALPQGTDAAVVYAIVPEQSTARYRVQEELAQVGATEAVGETQTIGRFGFTASGGVNVLRG